MTDARVLNWAGHSLETIAAMYESDAACRELDAGAVDWGYLDAAAKAEFLSARTDRLSADLIKSS